MTPFCCNFLYKYLAVILLLSKFKNNKFAEILLEEAGLKLDECSLEDESVIEGQYYER